MPRMVDHHQRRDELIEAAWQLIVAEGLPGITIRRLAERSGWSSGAVRHYLPTREAILDAAAQRVAALIERRMRAAAPADHPVRALSAVLKALLPTDDEMRLASRVWLAFVGQAASDGTIAEAQGIVYRDLNAVLVGLLRLASARGYTIVGGPADAARHLQALVDGLTVHVLLDRVTPDEAGAAVGAWVDRLVTRATPDSVR